MRPLRPDQGSRRSEGAHLQTGEIMTNQSTFWRLVLVAAVLLGVARVGQAAVVNYSESVSGDLSGSGAPLTTFTFDVGANTVSSNASNQVSFAFIIPAGTELLGGQLQLGVAEFFIAEWALFSGSLNSSTGTTVENIGGLAPGTFLLSSIPLGPGNYNSDRSRWDPYNNARLYVHLYAARSKQRPRTRHPRAFRLRSARTRLRTSAQSTLSRGDESNPSDRSLRPRCRKMENAGHGRRDIRPRPEAARSAAARRKRRGFSQAWDEAA